MTISIAGARGAWLWACGPYLPETPTIGSTAPLHLEAYQSGDLGVVRPTFARRYLVQAYRVLSGRPPLTDLGIRASTTPIGGPRTDARSAVDAWIEIRDRVLGKDPRSDWEQRDVSRTIDRFYNSIVNCHDDAFVTAARTLEGRIATFGIASVAVREWTQAQAAVFANCSGTELVLPKAPSSTDPLRRADHEYQVAAAYFYATDYPEAANRFRKIALNTASPWQSYGRFLAARATIRSATVPDHPRWRRDELLAEADIELQAVLSDARASTLHESARRLLAFVEVRLHPVKRLAALSHELGAAPITASQDLIDYRYLMDRFVADPLEFMSGSAADVDALMSANDLTNWVLIMQSSDDVSRARALQRWQETRSALWLVPILWQLPLDHSAVPAVLEAASAVARDSPAYPTLAFLRARLLLARGERAEARKLLAILPREPEAGFHAETINLLNAVRLQLAESLDEALATAPRVVIAADDPAAPPSIFDEDGRELFTDRLPLQRLIEASKSAILPNRLRIHVANAALARALVLRRESAAKEAAQSMRELLPRIRIDIERYLSTTTAEERHRAGVLLLLRVPALRAYVPGRHDSASYEGTTRDPRKFDHLFRENWWCVRDSRLASTYGDDPAEIRSLLKLKGRAPYPEFLTSDERAVVEQERAELVAVGSPQGYLAEEAIKWARARPTDLRAAEALALVVEGGRWSCSVPASSRRAFQTLHQLFPTSEWARRTRYWYTGS